METSTINGVNMGWFEYGVTMRFFYAAAAALLFGATAGWFWPANAQQHMPMDTPTTIGGVQVVCTGVGDGAQTDPRWHAYPIRIEFSNKAAQYLSGAHVDLSTSAGKTLASVDCDGAWVLFQLPSGSYKATATLLSQPGGGSASASFSPPASGQKRVVIQFPVAQNQ
ncbi:MAG TPA: hypothetical protein VGK90_02735 [Rhizomicrobium sp.]|jgi:hypothetical protein